ncbi:MAG: molybdate ABC transporter substrate-binding protein [Puia sp.]|nr:molybdate ABC transporter substrate-binding protein [Puia sp.]
MNTVKRITRFAAFLLFLVVAGQASAHAQAIRVAAAANVQFVIRELATDFGKQQGAVPEVIIESSGKLTAQIENGAPFDVFVSADTSYPLELYKKGFVVGKPAIYASGGLVLWTLRSDVNVSSGPEALLSDKIKKIAVADPTLAPYGAATVAFLKRLGLYEQIKDKLVFGQSISQVNQFILSGGADIGFTARSIVLADEMKGKGSWIPLDSTLYSPIAQSAALLTYGRDHHPAAAEAFYRYLYSRQARALFLKYGYLVPW